MGVAGFGIVFAGERMPFILSEGTGGIVWACVFVIILLKSPYIRVAPVEWAVASVHTDENYRRHRRDTG